VRIATLYEDVEVFIKEAQAAPAEWLDANREVAAQYCATTLVAMATLKSDFDLFVEAVNTYVEEPPTEEELEQLFALIQEYDFWTEDGGLGEESIEFMIEVATASGVLTEPMDAADVVDRETLDRAVELANEQLAG
jgi:NitT/TauT family transport system substrate-binding protein